MLAAAAHIAARCGAQLSAASVHTCVAPHTQSCRPPARCGIIAAAPAIHHMSSWGMLTCEAQPYGFLAGVHTRARSVRMHA
jgi:hypothetical protein